MLISRKAYSVVFGEIVKGVEYIADTKRVMAETTERAIEIAKGLFTEKELKTLFIREVELLVEDFDAD